MASLEREERALTDLLRRRNAKQISVEIEPPTLGRSIRNVFKVLDPLVEAGIKYINITYHGEHVVGYVEQNNQRFSVAQRRNTGTVGIAGVIQARYASKGIEAVPHFICTGFTRHDVEEYVIDLGFLGITNVMALRGDAPKDPEGRKMSFTRTLEGARDNFKLRVSSDLSISSPMAKIWD